MDRYQEFQLLIKQYQDKLVEFDRLQFEKFKEKTFVGEAGGELAVAYFSPVEGMVKLKIDDKIKADNELLSDLACAAIKAATDAYLNGRDVLNADYLQKARELIDELANILATEYPELVEQMTGAMLPVQSVPKGGYMN